MDLMSDSNTMYVKYNNGTVDRPTQYALSVTNVANNNVDVVIMTEFFFYFSQLQFTLQNHSSIGWSTVTFSCIFL